LTLEKAACGNLARVRSGLGGRGRQLSRFQQSGPGARRATLDRWKWCGRLVDVGVAWCREARNKVW